MKPTAKTDVICIEKVQKYIALIGEAYSTFGINSLDDFESNAICQLAIAQSITNVHEIKKKISSETLSKAPAFDKILLKAARNIASHDYDSLNLEVVYKRTLQLLKPEVSQELEAIVNDFKSNNSGGK